MKRTRWLKPSIGVATTAGFVWLLARELDGDALGRAFAGASISAVVLALSFMAAGHAVRIVRWWLLLRALEPSLQVSDCVRPFLTGMAVNNVMPFRAGDALRVMGFRRQLRSPAMRVLGTLVIERALDLIFLSGIFFLALLGLPDGAFPRSFVVAAAWLAAAGMAAILGAMVFLPLFERYWDSLPGQRFFAKQQEAVSGHVAHLVQAVGLVRSVPRTLGLIGLSVVVWVCEGLTFVTVAAALQADVAPLGPWLSLAAGTLATAIPSSPGYVGTFDYFAAQGLAAYGASPEVAAALALTVHALWIPLTVVGLLSYWLPHAVGQRKKEPDSPSHVHDSQDQRNEDGRCIPSLKTQKYPSCHDDRRVSQRHQRQPGEAGQDQEHRDHQTQHQQRSSEMSGTQRARVSS